MAIVTGTLTDFQGVPRPTLSPRVVFTPDGLATRGAGVFFSLPISIIPNTDGTFSVGLVDTETLAPADIFYRMKIEWLDAAGNFIGFDEMPGELRVPAAGGVLGDLTTMPRSALEVWVGETDNAAYRFWYQPSTGILRS